jgi:flagellar export protein FliJ
MAAKFRFSLEAVLRQRMALEEREQRRVAELERERLAIEERIRGCQRSIAGAKEDLRRRLSSEKRAQELSRGASGVSLSDVRLQANASLHMVARAQQAVLELAGVHRRLDAARLELIRATTARKAIELLKAKRFEEWRNEVKKREAAEMDELNVMRHGRSDAHEEAA